MCVFLGLLRSAAFAHPVDASLHLSTSPLRLRAPLEYQVHQRSSAAAGHMVVAGSLNDHVPRPCDLEVRLVGSGAPGTWQPLTTLARDVSEFSVPLAAPAGGWYQLELRWRHQGSVLGQTAVAHVGVGEIFVVAGQSNAANHGEEKLRTQSHRVATFHAGTWRLAEDPQPGASGSGGSFLPPLGDALAERYQVPIGFVAAGVGATSIREWLPEGRRFPNPPTLTRNVEQLPSGEWMSRGLLFRSWTDRLRALGPNGFRAILWHQGESDANQTDPARTLPGTLYRQYLEEFMTDTQIEIGWRVPWFVAQVSYHTPDAPGSPDIRAAQAAVVRAGIALAGPDSDAMTGSLRDHGGRGVHFSGAGLKEHAARWLEKVGPWLDLTLLRPATTSSGAGSTQPGAPPKLILPGRSLSAEGRRAFVFLPPEASRRTPQPWILYAPTLPGYPDEAERWMHEQFLAAGIAVAGVDVGEAYGSPASHGAFDALYQRLTHDDGFAPKPCLFGRSRGGLWVSSWAIARPDRVAGIIGIYPVFDFRTYPGVTNAAGAYGLSPAELLARQAELNPVAKLSVLAQQRIPVALIHGDRDTVVPLEANSLALQQHYRATGVESLARLILLPGQGHSFFPGYFRSQELVDFAIAFARRGAQSGR